MEKIKVILADDNKTLSDFIIKNLEKHDDIEIIGIAHSDEDEIKMIDELKPQIVLTDLMRNGEYSGLDIIKNYSQKNDSPKFLIISAEIITVDIIRLSNVAGYIQKLNIDYDKLYNEIKRIDDDMKGTPVSEVHIPNNKKTKSNFFHNLIKKIGH